MKKYVYYYNIDNLAGIMALYYALMTIYSEKKTLNLKKIHYPSCS